MEGLGLLLVGFIWLLNFAISFWNSYAVGKSWPYTKQMGGFAHFITWMGYLMAICGFSWCFLIPLALLAYANEWAGFNQEALVATLNLGYIVIAPTIVFSGLFIWIDSLVHAWKTRTIGSIAVGGWNTVAQIHNTISVFQNIGPAFDNVGKFFKEVFSGGDSDDTKGKLGILVIVLVFTALLAGFLLATAIVVKTARAESRVFEKELANAA